MERRERGMTRKFESQMQLATVLLLIFLIGLVLVGLIALNEVM